MISLLVGAILVRVLSGARAKRSVKGKGKNGGDFSNKKSALFPHRFAWLLRNSNLRHINEYLDLELPNQELDCDNNLQTAAKLLVNLEATIETKNLFEKTLLESLRNFVSLIQLDQRIDEDGRNHHSECLKILKVNLNAFKVDINDPIEVYDGNRVCCVLWLKARQYLALRADSYESELTERLKLIPRDKMSLVENFCRLNALFKGMILEDLYSVDTNSKRIRQFLAKLKSFSSDIDAKSAYLVLKAFVPEENPDLTALEQQVEESRSTRRKSRSIVQDLVEELVIKYIRMPCSIYASALGDDMFEPMLEETRVSKIKTRIFSQRLLSAWVYYVVSKHFARHGQRELIGGLVRFFRKGDFDDSQCFEIKIDQVEDEEETETEEESMWSSQ